jgi:hypothetical protein
MPTWFAHALVSDSVEITSEAGARDGDGQGRAIAANVAVVGVGGRTKSVSAWHRSVEPNPT